MCNVCMYLCCFCIENNIPLTNLTKINDDIRTLNQRKFQKDSNFSKILQEETVLLIFVKNIGLFITRDNSEILVV